MFDPCGVNGDANAYAKPAHLYDETVVFRSEVTISRDHRWERFNALKKLRRNLGSIRRSCLRAVALTMTLR
jgi:hypothetical protein